MTPPRYSFPHSGPASRSRRSSCQLPSSPRQESEVSQQARARQAQKGIGLQIHQAGVVQPEERWQVGEEGKGGRREEVISWLFKHINPTLLFPSLKDHNMHINYQSLNLFMSSSFRSLKKGCFRASFIEILRVGSRFSIFSTRSSPYLSKFLKWVSGLTPLNLGKVGLKSGRLSA